MLEQQVGETSVRELSSPLYDCKGWMRLVGVMSIIGGALQVLTIVGIVFAWLPIWMGVLLIQAAGRIEDAHLRESDLDFYEGLCKLKVYFVITGVLTLVGLIFAGLMILLMFTGVMAPIFMRR